MLLARKRLSASELARRIDVTQPYISRRLTGEIAFDVDDLARIAKALDVPVSQLFPRGDMTPGYSRLAERWTSAARPRRKTTRPAPGRPVTKINRPPNVPDGSRRPVLLDRRV